MEKANQILVNIQSSIQYVIDTVLNLAFQPLYAIIAIIQAIIEIWTTNDEEDNEAEEQEEPQPNVTVYPSANEGKYAEECELPACNEEHHIGFRINEAEQEEIDKIKKELNQ